MQEENKVPSLLRIIELQGGAVVKYTSVALYAIDAEQEQWEFPAIHLSQLSSEQGISDVSDIMALSSQP